MKEIKLPEGLWEYDENKPLGKAGGFGQVFLGRSKDYPELAVKRLHLSAASAAHREMAIAEAMVGEENQHIIRFLDAGEDAASGGYFVVMEKAERSLQDDLDGGTNFDSVATALILLDAAQGLLEAGNVVHRDLKPANLLLHEGRWKLADFGIARFVEEATSLHTLKDCLSPYYAAPEQWRFERATSATDLYSLGCIGYALLTGGPPFTKDPQHEHQHSAVPSFSCSDSRLSSLISMLLRKLPATRPSLNRVIMLLNTIVSQPLSAQSGAAVQLAVAGDRVSAKEQAEQAANEERKTHANQRKQIQNQGFEVLRLSAENLWEKIIAAAPAATRGSGGRQEFTCSLGLASLVINFGNSHLVLDPGMFAQSKWDMVGIAQILVVQRTPGVSWPSTLWFGRRPGTEDYRWHEIVFHHHPLSRSSGLVALTDPREVDTVLSNVMHVYDVSFGPRTVDDEDESDFHDRYMGLFALAADGQLRNPSTLPLRDWPSK